MKEDKKIGIYKITNKLNGKCYIGQSTNIEYRFEEHKKYKNRSSVYLHNSIKKYGEDNFNFEIIELCEEENLAGRAIYWIKFYNSIFPNGYNLTEGGSGGNTFKYRTIEQMNETRKKISSATKGEKNGFYKKCHSEEVKEKLRKINVGKILSEETKKKISEKLKNHVVLDSTKEKISTATKKQWLDNDFKQLMKTIHLNNKYCCGNTWNKNRINIYHKDTYEHKRIYKEQIASFLNQGYIIGLPPTCKKFNPDIRHCSTDNPVGISFSQKKQLWVAYINFKKHRYGTKYFEKKEEAIQHRIFLENLLLKIKQYDINDIDIIQSFKQGCIIKRGGK